MAKTKKSTINLTKEGKNNLIQEIVSLELEYKKVQKEIGEYLKDNPMKENFQDSVVSGLTERARLILASAKRKTQILAVAKVVESSKNIDSVQLGDFIRLKLVYDNCGDCEETNEIIELTGNVEAALGLLYPQISQESLLGKNIINKKVGDEVEFQVPSNETCKAQILEILRGLKNDPKQKVLAK